jgi:hypothetical protein
MIGDGEMKAPSVVLPSFFPTPFYCEYFLAPLTAEASMFNLPEKSSLFRNQMDSERDSLSVVLIFFAKNTISKGALTARTVLKCCTQQSSLRSCGGPTFIGGCALLGEDMGGRVNR